MVYKKSEIKGIAFSLARFLSRKIPVKKVIIFGSYAYGRPTKYSDIDLAVVSPAFKTMDDIKRIAVLLDATRKIKTEQPVDIEPLGFTPEELEEADYFSIGAEIKECGKVVYP